MVFFLLYKNRGHLLLECIWKLFLKNMKSIYLFGFLKNVSFNLNSQVKKKCDRIDGYLKICHVRALAVILFSFCLDQITKIKIKIQRAAF